MMQVEAIPQPTGGFDPALWILFALAGVNTLFGMVWLLIGWRGAAAHERLARLAARRRPGVDFSAPSDASAPQTEPGPGR